MGKVAEAHPNLANRIARASHEIGTHGYSHESVERMPLAKFKEDLHRSVEILRQQTGMPVLGHRAADFSISQSSLHLLECLVEEGLAYDSSIFPVRHPRYGVPGAWRYPHRILCSSGQSLVEFPVATLKMGRLVLPAAGGGYFRLFPFWLTRYTIHRLEQEGTPATCYLHPYELDPKEMQEIPYKVPPLLSLSQTINRATVKKKLRMLARIFRFITMAEAYKQWRLVDTSQ